MAVRKGDATFTFEIGADAAADDGAAEVGYAARQAGDLTLELFSEAGLHDVDRRGQHGPESNLLDT